MAEAASKKAEKAAVKPNGEPSPTALEKESPAGASEGAAAASASAPAAAPEQKPAEPDYLDQIMRLKAEFENFRRRVDKEKPELYRLGKAELLLRLLPVYDLLRRAHDEIQAQHAASGLAKGMEGIFKEFEKIFREEGVAAMESLCKPYDAMRHEVLGTVERPGTDDGTVAEVLETGFLSRDKVLRTAKVRIVKNAGKGMENKGEGI